MFKKCFLYIIKCIKWIANLTESMDFDGLKVDSCGNQRDMTKWAAEFAKPGRHPLMVVRRTSDGTSNLPLMHCIC